MLWGKTIKISSESHDSIMCGLSSSGQPWEEMCGMLSGRKRRIVQRHAGLVFQAEISARIHAANLGMQSHCICYNLTALGGYCTQSTPAGQMCVSRLLCFIEPKLWEIVKIQGFPKVNRLQTTQGSSPSESRSSKVFTSPGRSVRPLPQWATESCGCLLLALSESSELLFACVPLCWIRTLFLALGW